MNVKDIKQAADIVKSVYSVSEEDSEPEENDTGFNLDPNDRQIRLSNDRHEFLGEDEHQTRLFESTNSYGSTDDPSLFTDETTVDEEIDPDEVIEAADEISDEMENILEEMDE